jgi:TPR repeat protein
LTAPDTAGAKARKEGESPSPPPAGKSIASRFAEADSLLPLYRELVARANKGEGEAAYYVYKIHEACAYPRNRNNQQPAAADPDPDDWRTQEHSRKSQRAEKACPPELQQILATQDAAMWLKVAADLGYPLAQAMIAARLLDGNRDREDTEQARQFMRTAARSRDPETLLEIARNIPALGALPGETSVGRRADAWVLLACWNGLDCGPTSALVRSFVCNPREARRCEPTAGFEDTLQKASPARYAAAAALADQLMQAMNDGRWTDLGL